MNTKKKPEIADQVTNSNEPVGIDNRGESTRRYGQLDPEGLTRSRHGEKERGYQEKNEGLSPKSNSQSSNSGNGSKTEGAFGKDRTLPSDEENVRYRKDEK